MKKIISLLIISGIIVMFGFFSGCISDTNNDETQNDVANTFTGYANDYGNVVTLMRTTLTDHYNSMYNSGNMSDMMDQMMEYHSTMTEYMDWLNHDLDGMIEYCTSLGMHEESFWDEMQELHEDCLSEINDHYGNMMNMGDNMMMGYMGEMNDHMETMGPFMNRMEKYHEWMMDHDAHDHNDNHA